MNARPLDRRPDLPSPPRPPAGARPPPACASASSTRQETTVQLRSLPSFLGALSDADPVGRRRSLLIAAALLARAGGRECRGGRGVAPPPAGPCRRAEPRAAGRRPGVRPLELRAAATAAARRPDVARQRLGPRAASTSIGRGRSDSIGSRPPRRRSPPATRSSAPTTASAGWRPSSPRRSGSNTGHEAIGDDPRVCIRDRPQCRRNGPGCEMERDSE